MEKNNQRGNNIKNVKNIKNINPTAKVKKQIKQSSDKNLKPLKSPSHKSPAIPQALIKPELPYSNFENPFLQNDYGVSQYYSRNKVKTSQKKEKDTFAENYEYGNLNQTKDGGSNYFQNQQNLSKSDIQQSEYISKSFKKLKIPNPRGVINDEGKFVSVKKQKQSKKSYSFREKSISKHSFSLNFTAKLNRSTKKKQKKTQPRQISTQKHIDRQRQWKSFDKGLNKSLSYYQQQKKEIKNPKKKRITKEITKIESNNSKTSLDEQEQDMTNYEMLNNINFIQEIREEVRSELQASTSTVRKQKINESQLRERFKCIHMIAKLCGLMNMKRQTYSLAVHYLDQFIGQFPYPCIKIVGLASLTLALKMDDAQMLSKFCIRYMYNPQRTVKRNNTELNLKQKNKNRQSKEQAKDTKNRLSTILASKISEQKKAVKEDFTLEDILDFQNIIMVKFSFRLYTKTYTYWIDVFTNLWDGYVKKYQPQYFETIKFRGYDDNRNWNYLVQTTDAALNTMNFYNYSKVGLALGGIYLIARISLQQKKEETPWNELCRYYKVSLSKSTNIIFCDGIGINPLFGSFLSLFDLGIQNIIDCVQFMRKKLQPQMIRLFDVRKIQGSTKEDKLSTYVYNQQIYKQQ